MTAKSLNEFEVIEKLTKRKGTQIVSIIAETKPSLLKTGNPFYVNRQWTIRKVSHVNGMIGFNYENSVNNQREREDKDADFVAKPRKWGVRVQGTPFIQHTRKGETILRMYLDIKIQSAVETHYYDKVTGIEIDKERLKPFYQKGSSRQDLDKEVIPRDYELSNIVQLRVGGEIYPVKIPAKVA